MKHGKRPRKRQQNFIKAHGLIPGNWLVVKDMPDQMHLVHRYSDKTTRIIPKGDAREL